MTDAKWQAIIEEIVRDLVNAADSERKGRDLTKWEAVDRALIRLAALDADKQESER